MHSEIVNALTNSSRSDLGERDRREGRGRDDRFPVIGKRLLGGYAAAGRSGSGWALTSLANAIVLSIKASRSCFQFIACVLTSTKHNYWPKKAKCTLRWS
jgi:hypothetical protein